MVELREYEGGNVGIRVVQHLVWDKGGKHLFCGLFGLWIRLSPIDHGYWPFIILIAYVYMVMVSLMVP